MSTLEDDYGYSPFPIFPAKYKKGDVCRITFKAVPEEKITFRMEELEGSIATIDDSYWDGWEWQYFGYDFHGDMPEKYLESA